MNTGIFWVGMNSYFERDNAGYNGGDNQVDSLGDIIPLDGTTAKV